MQVNDCPPVPPAGTAGKEEVRSVDDQGSGAARPRTGQGFRKALERGRPDPAAGGMGGMNDGLQRRPLRGGFAPSLPPRPPLRRRRASPGWRHRTPSIGSSLARSRRCAGTHSIGAGALAGTEIDLSSASGQTVEARLLTHAASSRQTLSVVMDEIKVAAAGQGASSWPRGLRAHARLAGGERGRRGGRGGR